MSNKITSRIEVKVDGEVLLVKEDWVISLGGFDRTTVSGHQGVHGFTEEVAPPFVEGPISHKEDFSLKKHGKIENATITAKTNTGQHYVFRQAWRTEAPRLETGGGQVPCRFEAMEAQEL